MNKFQFIILTNQFGYNIYIADTTKTKNGLQITEDINEALIFSEMDSSVKIEFFKSLTGYDLKIKYL